MARGRPRRGTPAHACCPTAGRARSVVAEPLLLLARDRVGHGCHALVRLRAALVLLGVHGGVTLLVLVLLGPAVLVLVAVLSHCRAFLMRGCRPKGLPRSGLAAPAGLVAERPPSDLHGSTKRAF